MQQVSGLPWLIKCAGAAAVLLLACLATARFGSALQQPTVTTRDGTIVTLNRYVREPVPDLVLVGSSVAWRLKEEYFSRPGVRNLALAGGSSVTSLDIITRQTSLPKIVLIESNVLTRLPDETLIAKFSGGARTEALVLRPVRTAVAAYEAWNHTPPNPAQARAERERLLSGPPSTFDNKVYLDRAVNQMNEEDPTAPAQANVARIGELIDDIERRGSRAFLLEIPFAQEIEDTRSVRMSKAIIHAAFADRTRWLPIDPPLNELRWADGVHLDERSALLVVRAIEGALAERGR
ncbi:hypothetical protein ACFQZO_05260 [Bradyrhizobium sp. GCM10027634]|uniref:hypothetical protein n=1 Tax=unclassified Bradyrhizobium TaxID=2631580 RepID=UPI00188B5DCC|nr:hypothetical protein [Bradyrhizobium sp. CCBAU 53340]QOZ42943.1 hypothetical protein XH89_05270 [Bradyrhizobium sp. CCBAU 53340]